MRHAVKSKSRNTRDSYDVPPTPTARRPAQPHYDPDHIQELLDRIDSEVKS